MRIAWRRPPPVATSNASDAAPHTRAAGTHIVSSPANLACVKSDDMMTLVLGWLGPHDAHRSAAVCRTWNSSLAYAQWRSVVLQAPRDPRPSALQLTALLHPKNTGMMEELRLRMIVSGSYVWHDPENRLSALRHARHLRVLEISHFNTGARSTRPF